MYFFFFQGQRGVLARRRRGDAGHLAARVFGCDGRGLARRRHRRYWLYWLYWYKSTKTDAAVAVAVAAATASVLALLALLVQKYSLQTLALQSEWQGGGRGSHSAFTCFTSSIRAQILTPAGMLQMLALQSE